MDLGLAVRRIRRRARRMRVAVFSHPISSTVIGGLIVAILVALAGISDRGGEESNARQVAPAQQPLASRDQLPLWGPRRPTYACDPRGMCEGADHVALNSGVGNPKLGDERYFFSVVLNGDGAPVTDRLDVVPGDRLVLRISVTNNARIPGPSEPRSVHRSLTTRDLSAKLTIPGKRRTRFQLFAWVSADNAIPSSVFDSVFVTSRVPVALRYERGSAYLDNRARVGQQLSDSIVRDGVLLGFKKLDGKMSGCYCEAGYVTMRLRVV